MSGASPESQGPRRAWALWTAVIGAAVLAVFWLLVKYEPVIRIFSPGCVFHRVTGLHCPGCGMTRATFAALHGDFARAFRMNPLGMILLPAALAGAGLELIGWLCGKALPLRFNPGPKTCWTIAGVVMAFWVLRNIPVWPCTLLAPY